MIYTFACQASLHYCQLQRSCSTSISNSVQKNNKLFLHLIENKLILLFCQFKIQKNSKKEKEVRPFELWLTIGINNFKLLMFQQYKYLMDKLQSEILLVNKDITFDHLQYTQQKIYCRENSKDYEKQHQLDFTFRQTQFWQAINQRYKYYQQSIKQVQQSESQQDLQQLADKTNAISFIETSKNEESQMQYSSQSTRRKIMFKSMISKQPSDSSILKKPFKQINKIVPQLKQESMAEYFAIIKKKMQVINQNKNQWISMGLFNEI
ncbi:unnamed protein product [Paramecium octaurelia]|uniref:Uncharacterized protein n=1 Tax=Paramecium octaurelia TaxID=43137 RepID=A0A8S1TUN7_PAROT|nr:unnamed protein product [Paramecium octaurelia]